MKYKIVYLHNYPLPKLNIYITSFNVMRILKAKRNLQHDNILNNIFQFLEETILIFSTNKRILSSRVKFPNKKNHCPSVVWFLLPAVRNDFYFPFIRSRMTFPFILRNVRHAFTLFIDISFIKKKSSNVSIVFCKYDIEKLTGKELLVKWRMFYIKHIAGWAIENELIYYNRSNNLHTYWISCYNNIFYIEFIPNDFCDFSLEQLHVKV